MSDFTTVTIKSYQSKYTFQVEIDDLEMERLSYRKILGFRFRKSKYEYLNDIADILAKDILIQLEKIVEAQS